VQARADRLGFVPSLGVASLSGVCFGIAAPPGSHAWLAWFGFTPLLLVLRRPGLSLRRAFLLGWVGGLGVGLLGFPWIASLLERFADLPRALSVAGMLAYSGWMALPYGLWALAVQWGPRSGWAAWLWALASFAALMHVWPLVFPYTPVIGLAQHPEWIQIAELGGAPLVEFQALAVALLLCEALRSDSWRRAGTAVALALAVPLASTLVGQLRMRTLDRDALAAPRVVFGVVQPNTPVLWRDPDVAMKRLREPSREAEDKGAQIIVWPEAGTYPFLLPRPVSEDPSDPRGQVLLLHQTPTLFGAVTMPPDGGRTYNTLLHLAADGRVRGGFDKVKLVPFGEHLPGLDPELVQRFIPNVGQLARGEGVTRFGVQPRTAESRTGEPAETVAVGPMICAEDIHAGFAHAVARQPGGIEVFVNATIDAWYGAEQEPWEHLALAQFRSVEHRVPMVRSVSTGVSAVIDQSGRVVASLPARDVTPDSVDQFPPEILVVSVPLTRNTALAPTLYARGGWCLPSLCQLLALAQAAVWGVLRLRRGHWKGFRAQRQVA
jgi:apolipoprotein N-acyltransferase